MSISLPQIRIILVDDHELVRGYWKLLLNQDNRFLVMSECKDGSEAIAHAEEQKPDVMLMDINMYPVNGLDATKKIIAKNSSIKIIGFSINNQPAYAENMLKAGAKGYVTKNSSLQEVSYAIVEVFEGRTYICEEVRGKTS